MLPLKDSLKHKGLRNQLANLLKDKGITDEKVSPRKRRMAEHIRKGFA